MSQLFSEGVMSLFQKGGPVMYPILLASLIGLACLIYCLLILRRRVVMPPNLIDMAQELKADSDLVPAETACRRDGGPFAEVILTVIASRSASREEAETLVESSGRRAAHDLSRGVLALEVVAGVAPLLGLLGTVTGMYQVFMEVRSAGVKGIASISGGIGEALITTIAGLIVAIPAYVAAVCFSRQIESLTLEMERHAVALMSRLRGRG